MNFEITYKPTEAYYKETYEALINRSKWKKWEPLLAVLLIVVGINFFFFDKTRTLGVFPIFFIGAGIYELFKYYYAKWKWLNDRLTNKVYGKAVRLVFDEEGILHEGPFLIGKIKWSGFNIIHKSSKGVILKQEVGTAIYLSNSLFDNQKQIDFILSKTN